jgi:hypothetical protein
MASFTLPTFNLDVNQWLYPNNPTLSVFPDVSLIGASNLAWGRRFNVASTGGTGVAGVLTQGMVLLLFPLTDIAGVAEGYGDVVEVPAGSGRFYTVQFVDDLGKGFANEHRGALLSHGYTNPVTPSGVVPWARPFA